MIELQKRLMREMIAKVAESNSGDLVEDDMVRVILQVATLEGKTDPVERTIRFLNSLSRKSLNLMEFAMQDVKNEQKTNSGSLDDALRLALDEKLAHEAELFDNAVIKLNLRDRDKKKACYVMNEVDGLLEEEMEQILHILPASSLEKEKNNDYKYEVFFPRNVPQQSQIKLHDMTFGASVVTIRKIPMSNELTSLDQILHDYLLSVKDIDNLMLPAMAYLIHLIQIHMR